MRGPPLLAHRWVIKAIGFGGGEGRHVMTKPPSHASVEFFCASGCEGHLVNCSVAAVEPDILYEY